MYLTVLFFSINVIIPHSPPHPLSVCLHVRAPYHCHVVTSQPSVTWFLCALTDFFQPNQSPELKTGYQKQLIGTVSGSPALNLSLDNLFWVSNL